METITVKLLKSKKGATGNINAIDFNPEEHALIDADDKITVQTAGGAADAPKDEPKADAPKDEPKADAPKTERGARAR